MFQTRFPETAARAVATGLVLAVSTLAQAQTTITGAGATFPAPLYTKWAADYEKATGVRLNYQAIGSGGGIKQIKEKTVDFGASDEPLKAEELKQSGLVQWPMIMGGVVPIINLPGVNSNQLKLNGDVLARIFMGKITKWNDPAIASLNAGLKLPDTDITVVTRSDGSGTTWTFSSYLAVASDDFRTQVGVNKLPKWPGKGTIGGKGNPGVAAMVQQIVGSIGYVESAYASQTKQTTVALQNKDGRTVEIKLETVQAAAANADWTNAPGYYMVLVNQPGADSWPIVGVSYILVQEKQSDAAKALAVLKFFDWCYQNGAQAAAGLDYVPMPANVQDMVRKTWGTVMAEGKPVWTH